MSEKVEWTGTPSQLQNIGWFLSCLLLIPIPYAIWRWLVIRNTRYTLTDQRLQTTRGVLNKVTEDLELYRVRDTSLQQSLWERMFGLGEVTLHTTDASTPVLSLPWMPDAKGLREKVRALSEARRDAKRVRTIEAEHGHGGDVV